MELGRRGVLTSAVREARLRANGQSLGIKGIAQPTSSTRRLAFPFTPPILDRIRKHHDLTTSFWR